MDQMPLEKGTGQSFINVEEVFVSSQDGGASAGPLGQSDFKYEFPDYKNDVVALEMGNYNVPINALSQFTGRDKIDFRLRNPAIFGGQWKQFTATIPTISVVYNSPKNSSDLLSALFQAFRDVILQDTDFGGKVDIVPTPDPGTLVTLLCRTLYFDDPGWPGFGSTECEFLFGSGPNLATSAGPVLGFENEVDYVFLPVTYFGIQFRRLASDREAFINRFRYLDVFIDEFSLTEPFYRVFVPSIQSIATTVPEINGRARLMDKPIRLMKTLTFRLRLSDKLRPATPLPYFFNIKVYSLKSSYVLPDFNRRRSMHL